MKPELYCFTLAASDGDPWDVRAPALGGDGWTHHLGLIKRSFSNTVVSPKSWAT